MTMKKVVLLLPAARRLVSAAFPSFPRQPEIQGTERGEAHPQCVSAYMT
jgi:hypothetical protein